MNDSSGYSKKVFPMRSSDRIGLSRKSCGGNADSKPSYQNAFTLVELLVVIAIITVLAVLVFAALNPAGRLADTRDARRSSDVNEILTAVQECIVDNDGDATLCGVTDDGTTREIVDGAIVAGCDAECSVAAAECGDLSALVTQNYMASLPVDPSGAAASHTSYSIVSSGGVITIDACGAENTIPISVSR